MKRGFSLPMVFGGTVIAATLLCALLAPMILGYSDDIVMTRSMRAPGAEYWFGTDNLGRDIFVRTLSGARNSVIVTLRDLTKVGTVIDEASRAGANNIDGLSFTIREDREVRARALSEATRATKGRRDPGAGWYEGRYEATGAYEPTRTAATNPTSASLTSKPIIAPDATSTKRLNRFPIPPVPISFLLSGGVFRL